MLSREETREFYDRFGTRQDRQAFYEDRALDALVAGSSLEKARAVVELGSGTGRLALRLLSQELPAEATYSGFDLSSGMVGIASERLREHGDRATVSLTDGGRLPLEPASADRFLSTYVFDLLGEAEIADTLLEARRLLVPGGLLCNAGIAPGVGWLSRGAMAVWDWVHSVRPEWVGGCRPVAIRPFLDEASWSLRHHSLVVSFGITSEVLVAEKR